MFFFSYIDSWCFTLRKKLKFSLLFLTNLDPNYNIFFFFLIFSKGIAWFSGINVADKYWLYARLFYQKKSGTLGPGRVASRGWAEPTPPHVHSALPRLSGVTTVQASTKQVSMSPTKLASGYIPESFVSFLLDFYVFLQIFN